MYIYLFLFVDIYNYIPTYMYVNVPLFFRSGKQLLPFLLTRQLVPRTLRWSPVYWTRPQNSRKSCLRKLRFNFKVILCCMYATSQGELYWVSLPVTDMQNWHVFQDFAIITWLKPGPTQHHDWIYIWVKWKVKVMINVSKRSWHVGKISHCQISIVFRI